MDKAKEFVNNLNRNDYIGLYNMFGKKSKEKIDAGLTMNFTKRVLDTYGIITRIGEPTIFVNWARFKLTGQKGLVSLRLTLGTDGMLEAYAFDPVEADLPVPELNTTRFMLPFRERWQVTHGGTTSKLNYHNDQGKSSLFAIDFDFFEPEGSNHRGTGYSNEDYFAFGREILTVADGTVVETVDGVSDNKPRSIHPFSISGNMITIKHKDNEFTSYMHLKKGSQTVRVGDRVKAGQTIALCGNSGSSDGPHLHFQLTNTNIFADSTGIQPAFSGITVTRSGKTYYNNMCYIIKNDFVVNKSAIK